MIKSCSYRWWMDIEVLCCVCASLKTQQSIDEKVCPIVLVSVMALSEAADWLLPCSVTPGGK